MNKKEYDKTWYYKFTPMFLLKTNPDNWICGRPIKIFGYCIGFLWKIAKSNYQWDNK